MGEITALIRAAQSGDSDAVSRLFTLLYRDLHQLAHARLRGHDPNTLLDTTSLVHETYVRFIKVGDLDVEDRRHFFAYAARVMRSIVVDFARRRNAIQRGGGREHVEVDAGTVANPRDRRDEILRVHDAVEELARVDEELARLVELRYFAGLQVGEIAEAFGVTERTVERQWHKARAILFATLR